MVRLIVTREGTCMVPSQAARAGPLGSFQWVGLGIQNILIQTDKARFGKYQVEVLEGFGKEKTL